MYNYRSNARVLFLAYFFKSVFTLIYKCFKIKNLRPTTD